jgi:hypothetical protein
LQERWRNTVHSMQQLVRRGDTNNSSTWDLRHDSNTFTGINNKKVSVVLLISLFGYILKFPSFLLHSKISIFFATF